MAKRRLNAEDVKTDIGINPTITPVDTLAAPVAPDYNEIKRNSLANFLQQAVPEYVNFADKERKLRAKQDAQKALEFDFRTNGLQSYAEAREKGLLDVRSDPTVKLAFNQALGREMAIKIRDDLQTMYMDNFTALEQISPKDFSNWYQGSMTQLIEQNNPDLLNAVGASSELKKTLDGHFNALRNSHNQANFAWTRKQLGVNFEGSLTLATEDVDWTNPTAIADSVNIHNDDKFANHSSYTGRNINEFTAGWLANRLKYAQNPLEVDAIREAIPLIKAGSGSLSDTSHWKPFQAQLVEGAATRFTELNSRVYRERTLAINNEQREITTDFQDWVNEGNSPESYDWSIYEGTTTMSSFELETQRQALLRSAAFEEPITMDRRFEINNMVAEMDIMELDDALNAAHQGTSDLLPNPTLAELSQFSNAVTRRINGGKANIFADSTFKETERLLGQMFGLQPLAGGGFSFAKGDNKKLFIQAQDRLRMLWANLYDDPAVLLGYLPEGQDYEQFQGKRIYELRNNPNVISSVRTNLINQIAATLPGGKFPATTIGGQADGTAPLAPAGQGEGVIKKGDTTVRFRTSTQ